MVPRASPQVDIYSALDALPADVLAALQEKQAAGFFNSLAWFEVLLATGMKREPELNIYVARDKAMGTGIILLAQAGDHGRELSSLTNHYSISFAPVYLGDEDKALPLLQILCAHLYAETPSWVRIDLRCLRVDRPATLALRAALSDAGYRVDTFYQYANWYAQVEPFRYRDYLSARPSRLRNTLSRKHKAATKKYRVTVTVHTEPGAELDAAVEAFQAVYARSWKGAEPSPDFMPRLIRDCAALGIARLGTLRLDDEIAAVQFWIVQGNVAVIYKLAHRPQFETLSPGSLLTAEMFKYTIDVDGVSEIDFGIGDEPYKRDWVDQQREMVGIEALNTGTLLGLASWLRRSLRNMLRRLGIKQYRPVRLP